MIERTHRQYSLLLLPFITVVALLVLMRPSFGQVQYQTIAQQNPVLAPAQNPIANVEVSQGIFAFPTMLPNSGLPLTASALFIDMLTTGINPLLVALLILVVALGYRHHKKVTAPEKIS